MQGGCCDYNQLSSWNHKFNELTLHHKHYALEMLPGSTSMRNLCLESSSKERVCDLLCSRVSKSNFELFEIFL